MSDEFISITQKGITGAAWNAAIDFQLHSPEKYMNARDTIVDLVAGLACCCYMNNVSFNDILIEAKSRVVVEMDRIKGRVLCPPKIHTS